MISQFRKCLAGVACFSIFLFPPISEATETELYYQGDINQYPSPAPVIKVKLKSMIPKDEFAISKQTLSRMQEYGSKAVKVTLLNVMSQDLTDRSGNRRIIAELQWENRFPRMKVDKKSLEGKADRTMGAGGLFSGTAGKGGGSKGFIEKDVPYKVPKWGDHVVLLADGIAYPLDPESAELKRGARPDRGMVLPRQHATRKFQFGFHIPENAGNLAFHFFDYENGHITIPLKGDVEKAKRGGWDKPVKAIIRTKQLEFRIEGIDTIPEFHGQKAPAGWQFKKVRILGRSMSVRRGQGDIVQLNAERDLWLQVQKGFIYSPQKVDKRHLRFFPEYLSFTQAVFLLPESETGVNLILRAGAKTFSLPAGGGEKLALPEAGNSWKDGEIAEFTLLKKSYHQGKVILDMVATNHMREKGLEYSPFRQFQIRTEGKSLRADKKQTENLAHGAKRIMVLPPEVSVRFLLAFKGGESPVALHIKGIKNEGELMLNGVPDGDMKALLLTKPAEFKRAIVARQKPKSVEVSSGSRVRKREAHSTERVSRSPVKAYRLPDWDIAGALQEKEQEKGIEHAIDLSKSLAVKGNIGGKDDREDYYYLDIQGKPQLWGIEAAGASVYALAYIDVSHREQIQRFSDRKTGEVRILNLLLAPGRHWIKISSYDKSRSEYQLRAIAMGEPAADREYEPNDDISRANRLMIDESVSGLMSSGDADWFRFSLNAVEHLQLTLQTARKMKGRFYVSGETQVREQRAKSGGETVTYNGIFSPGDYQVQVRSVGQQPSPESYRLSLSRMDSFAVPGKESSSLPLLIEEVHAGDEAAAYWAQAQKLNRRLRITNQGQVSLSLTLKVWESDYRWHARLGEKKITLEAGKSREVSVDVLVEPDAIADNHVSVTVAAVDQQGVMKSYHINLKAVCGAEPVNPQQHFSPPDSLLGGINVAWLGMGAKSIPEKWQHGRYIINQLFDGLAPGKGGLDRPGFRKDEPDIFTVKLAGSSTVPVKGIALNPVGNCSSKDWLRDFEVELSKDGVRYEKSLHGILKQLPREQFFVLEKPTMATHARLRFLGTHADKNRRVCLGEWKVIADPSFAPHSKGMNIANPKLGGHVVWRSFKSSDHQMNQLLTGESNRYASTAKMFNDRPNIWVVGFEHDRMARIASLEWEHHAKSPQGKQLPNVQIAVSQSGPVGPWKSLGEWPLNGDGPVSRFSLKVPAWARFVRFMADVEKTQYFDLPRQIRIFEQATESHYRSVVGEWGHYAEVGPYEWQETAPTATKAAVNIGNRSKERAISVKYGKAYSGRASLGRYSSWYQLDIPKGSNTLEWEISGDPVLTTRPILMTIDGKNIPIRSKKVSGKKSQYAANVTGGASYLLKIEEPPRSIVFTWDNSGSVSSYLPNIYQMLNLFTEQVQPTREYVNLLPFQDKDPSMLMENWSDQPFNILQALNDYSRKDSSSNAELNLKQAVGELEDQDGNRAVIIITDAESGQESGKSELWEPINRVYPRIFSLELQAGNPSSQDRMQDWSFVNSGHYSYFRNQSDLDTGFERAVCMLRRPAQFKLVTSVKYQKPAGPGNLQVLMTKGSDDTAIEIILDASGSMYKKLGGETRIAIAKSVLKDLMKTSIPKGTPLALRIYGHRKARACDTKLEIPLKPFNPQNAVRIIKKVDPKNRSRTPLAESLTLVAEDLKSASGKRLVILLTDGEESCGGDPEEAIRNLREQDMDITVNIVGLAIDSTKAINQFNQWAKLGGGSYFEAKDQRELKAALEKALFPKYQLLDKNGSIVMEGIADGSSSVVPSGTYKLKVLTSPIRSKGEITISEGKTLRVKVAD